MPPPNSIINKGGPHIKPANIEIAELISSIKFISLCLKAIDNNEVNNLITNPI